MKGQEEREQLQHPEYGFDPSPAWYSHGYTEFTLRVVELHSELHVLISLN